MTLLDPIVVKCPHCNTLMSDYELMSYTVHNSSYYSDGKSESDPILNGSKEILFCTQCTKTFWRDEAILRDEDAYKPEYEGLPMANDVMDQPWKFADDAYKQGIIFYKGLLDRGFATTELQNIYLRTQLWWAINDLMRGRLYQGKLRGIGDFFRLRKHRLKNALQYRSYATLRKSNLETLIELYAEDISLDVFFQVNILREMGRFKEAKAALENHKGSKGKTYQKFVKKIRRRDDKVFMVR